VGKAVNHPWNIDKDFDSFNPCQDKWLHISLRELISSNGDVQIFESANKIQISRFVTRDCVSLITYFVIF